MKILWKAKQGTNNNGYLLGGGGWEPSRWGTSVPGKLRSMPFYILQFRRACPSPLFAKLETSFTEKEYENTLFERILKIEL